MRRRLFTLAAGASAVLCAAACVLWVRSYRVAEFAVWRCRNMNVAVSDVEWYTQNMCAGSYRGRVLINWERIVWPKAYPHYQRPAGDWRWDYRRERYPAEPDLLFAFGPYDELDELPSWMRRLGFGYWNTTATATLWNDFESQLIPTHHLGFRVPYWALMASTIVTPASWLLHRHRRRRRRKEGRCPACGYDLRATPERCPECGTAAGGERAA
jgi:hypothetical protein